MRAGDEKGRPGNPERPTQTFVHPQVTCLNSSGLAHAIGLPCPCHNPGAYLSTKDPTLLRYVELGYCPAYAVVLASLVRLAKSTDLLSPVLPEPTELAYCPTCQNDNQRRLESPALGERDGCFFCLKCERWFTLVGLADRVQGSPELVRTAHLVAKRFEVGGHE